MSRMKSKNYNYYRWIGLIVLLVVLGNVVLSSYYLKQFEDSLIQTIQHQGVLLSQTLETALGPFLNRYDIKGLNERINHLAEARNQDIEINIVRYEDHRSIIIASNIPENIEPASNDEHLKLKLAILEQKPIINIEADHGLEIEDPNDTERPIQPGDFDFHALKFVDIMAPIGGHGDYKFGINIKLSLDPLEAKKTEMINRNIIAMSIEIIIILIGLSVLTLLLIRERSNVFLSQSSKLQAELKALQAQVNPHFLFNALNTLSSHIKDQPDLAEQLTLSLSDLYRKILSTTNNGFWVIDEEISLITSYLNIESMRLQDRLIYSIHVDDKAKKFKIPCLIIFPLVENAVKHGINRFIKGGRITLDIRLKDELMISVSDQSMVDNNFPAAHPVPGEKKGVENIKRRLSLVYGNRAALFFQSTQSGAQSKIQISDILGQKSNSW
jgi:hypothetical protein